MAQEATSPSPTNHSIQLPESDQEVSFEVDYIPTELLPEGFFEYTSNAARVNIGGRDFTIVMGKTVTNPAG